MKNTQYKQFINTLPTDTRTIVEYAISVFKDLEKQELKIDEKEYSTFSFIPTLNNIDKATLAIFISLATVNTTARELLNNNSVSRDTILEFLESENDNIVVTIAMKNMTDEEMEKTYSENFYFLNYLLNKENMESEKITPEFLTYTILNNNESTKIIDRFYRGTYNGVNCAADHRSFVELSKRISLNKEKIKQEPLKKVEIKEKSKRERLDKLGINISEKENLHKAIGRDNEIRNIEIALKTPSKKGVILVGDTGVGKRSIVEGLAYNIKTGNVPDGLKNKEIIELDLASLIAGTSYRGQFEEKVKAVLDEAKKQSDVILFIDGIHKGINSGEENKIDFVSILSSYLSRGEISVIATTNNDTYVNTLLANDNISSKLWKITVEEPKEEIVEEILYDLLEEIASIMGVAFPLDSKRREFMIRTIVNITSKEKRGYFSSGNNPDLAKGMLERTFAIASINNHSEVNEKDLIEAIETDESISKEAREKQSQLIREKLLEENNLDKESKVIPLQLIKNKNI